MFNKILHFVQDHHILQNVYKINVFITPVSTLPDPNVNIKKA